MLSDTQPRLGIPTTATEQPKDAVLVSKAQAEKQQLAASPLVTLPILLNLPPILNLK